MSLALVILGIQGFMLDTALVKDAAKPLGTLNGDRADKARLARGITLFDFIGNGIELGIDGSVNQVVHIFADDGFVRRDCRNTQLVDLTELGILGHGGTRHARKLVVQTEIILQRDGSKGLVLFPDLHVLLCFDSLMKAFRPTASLHDAAGELVDDLDFAAGDNVVDVAMEHELRLQCLLQVIGQLARGVGVDVVDAKQGFHLGQADLGGDNGALAFIKLEVNAFLQRGNSACKLVVHVSGRGTRT